MQLLPIVVALLAAGASAQQFPLSVQDLVRPAPYEGGGGPPPFVQRAFADVLFEGTRPFHDVAGARHLASWLRPDLLEDASERQGLFSEASLAAALAALTDLDEGAVSLTSRGDRVLLRTAHPEQAAAALDAIRKTLPPRIQVAVTLQRLTGDATTDLLSGEHTFEDGTVHVFADVVERRIVRDFEVELAQAATTANPVVDVVKHGASIALRARPVPFRDAVVLEAVLRVGTPLPTEPLVLYRAMGPLDRVDTRVDEGGFACLLSGAAPVQQPGATPPPSPERRVRLQNDWTCTDGSRLRLTCVASWRAPSAQDRTPPIVQPAPLLGAPVLGFGSSRRPDGEEPRHALPLIGVVEGLQGEHGGDVVQLLEKGGQSPVLLLTGADSGRLVRELDAAFAFELQPVHLELEILDAPAAADVAAQGTLPDGVRVVGRVSQPALLGLPVAFASGRERSYVRDWEVEVAQAARIADPKIGVVEDGWFATAQVVPPLRGAQPRLHLSLDLQRVEELRRTSITINSAMTALAAVSDDQRTPAVWLPQDDVWVELPVTRSMRVDTVMELDQQGQAVLRRSASSLFGDGRALVVRARVR